jgi:hypothetical protein
MIADILTPSGKVLDVHSEACAEWVLRHCRSSVQGRPTPSGYVITFADETEAFRARWL